MRNYLEFIQEFPQKIFGETETFEMLMIDSYEYPKRSSDYGLAFVYHFFQMEFFQQYTTLLTRIEYLIKNSPKLLNIEVIPCYEIGTDFLVQCKPPSEGYRLSTFQEYLTYGSCRPAPWFFRQWCLLQESVDEYMSGLELYDRRLLHSQLVKPNGNVYWADKDGWLLYLPSMKRDDYDYGDIHLLPEIENIEQVQS